MVAYRGSRPLLVGTLALALTITIIVCLWPITDRHRPLCNVGACVLLQPYKRNDDDDESWPPLVRGMCRTLFAGSRP